MSVALHATAKSAGPRHSGGADEIEQGHAGANEHSRIRAQPVHHCRSPIHRAISPSNRDNAGPSPCAIQTPNRPINRAPTSAQAHNTRPDFARNRQSLIHSILSSRSGASDRRAVLPCRALVFQPWPRARASRHASLNLKTSVGGGKSRSCFDRLSRNGIFWLTQRVSFRSP